MARFGIARLSRSADYVVATGRCHSGRIYVGLRFDRIIDETTGERYTAALVVKKINAYRRALAEIQEGLTAELVMVGELREGLDGDYDERWILVSAPARQLT